MRNAHMTPVNVATAEADNSQPVGSVNAAIVMIYEGNALEEQGSLPEAMAL